MKYEDRSAAILDKVSTLENAKENGKEIGKKEGGKIKAIEVARNSVKVWIDIDTIISITGLERIEIVYLLYISRLVL